LRFWALFVNFTRNQYPRFCEGFPPLTVFMLNMDIGSCKAAACKTPN
jgi:hypothetical protein